MEIVLGRTPDRKFVDKEGSRSNDGEVDAGGSASAVERIRCGTTVRFSYPHVCFVKLRVEHVLRDTKLRRISTVSWGWRGGMKYSLCIVVVPERSTIFLREAIQQPLIITNPAIGGRYPRS